MSTVTEFLRFLVRGGVASALAALNEIPLGRELIVATDARNLKVGNGSDNFNALPWLLPSFAAASGTDTITATYTDKPVLFDGMRLYARAAGANTGTATFNPNGLGALTIYKLGGQALEAGDIYGEGHELTLLYRASPARYELLNPASLPSGTLNANVVYSSTTASDTGGTAIPRDNTIPQITEGVPYSSLDCSITPTRTDTVLEVDLDIPVVSASGAQDIAVALFRDSDVNAIAASMVTISAASDKQPIRMRARVPSNAATVTTFTVRWAAASSTGYLLRDGSGGYFGGTLKASLQVRELEPQGTELDLAYLVSMLEFAGADASTTFTDYKGKTWTAGGNAQIDTSLGYNTLLLDGSGDFISTPDHADWALGSIFTVEFYAKKTSSSGNYHVSSQIDGSGSNFRGHQIRLSATAFLLTAYNSNAGTTISATVTHDTSLHHWAIASNGTSVWLYMDGVQVATGSAATIGNSTGTMRIGIDWDGTSTPFNGHIKGIRYFKNQCRYPDGTTFTPPALPWS